MAKVRATGNKSTECAVELGLKRNKIRGWVKHPLDIVGKPDFFFRRRRLVLFVDGCFWHACPTCGRLPKSRVQFWAGKIDENRRRDNRIRRRLRASGFTVLRIWEHEVRTNSWLERVRTALAKPNSTRR